MNEVSVTITAGEGCEEHNHGLEYRSKLEHRMIQIKIQ